MQRAGHSNLQLPLVGQALNCIQMAKYVYFISSSAHLNIHLSMHLKAFRQMNF